MNATNMHRKDFGMLNSNHGGFIKFFDCLVDITNGATHFVEYQCVELLLCLEEPNGMERPSNMR
jgi:hypothetical protein